MQKRDQKLKLSKEPEPKTLEWMEWDGINTSGPGSKPGPTRLPGRSSRRSRSTQRPDESAIASAARPARASCSPCAALLCAAAATPMLSLLSPPLPFLFLPSPSFPRCSSHPTNIYLMVTSTSSESTPHVHLPHRFPLVRLMSSSLSLLRCRLNSARLSWTFPVYVSTSYWPQRLWFGLSPVPTPRFFPEPTILHPKSTSRVHSGFSCAPLRNCSWPPFSRTSPVLAFSPHLGFSLFSLLHLRVPIP